MTIRFRQLNQQTALRNGYKVLDNTDSSAALVTNSNGFTLSQDETPTGARLIDKTVPNYQHPDNFYLESDQVSSYVDADQQTVSFLVRNDIDFDSFGEGRFRIFFRSGVVFYFTLNHNLRVEVFGVRDSDNLADLPNDPILKLLFPGNFTQQNRDASTINKSAFESGFSHFAITANYNTRQFELYVNGFSAGKIDLPDGIDLSPQSAPTFAPNTILKITSSIDFADFRIENKVLSQSEVVALTGTLPVLFNKDLFTFATNNGLKKDNVTGAVDSFDDLDQDKFLKRDFTSSSAVAGLNTTGLDNKSKAIQVVRGLQRLLFTGLAIGPDSNGSITYGNRLQLSEAFLLLRDGFYSASVLARATEAEVNKSIKLFGPSPIPNLNSATVQVTDPVIVRAVTRAKNRAKLLIASARQRAHLVSLAYINAKNLTSPALAAANRGPVDELTFENQFNSSQYHEVPEDRSVYSSSAYLVALKELMDEHITKPEANSSNLLSKRRPDIEDIVLSSENALKLQPKLNIVNRVLRFHARPETDSTTPLADAQQDTTQYPLLFPFNMAHESVISNLDGINQSTYEVHRVLGGLTSRSQDTDISPSMLDVVATDPAYSVATSPALSDSLDNRTPWGFEQASGSATRKDHLAPIVKVTEFVKRADIEEHELHELLFADLSVAEIAEDKHLDLYFNQPVTGTSINAANALRVNADVTELENLDALRQDRMHRFLRMSKVSGLNFVELHRLLRATKNRLNPEFVRIVESFKRLNDRFDITLDQFMVLIGDIRDVGEGNRALGVMSPLQMLFHRSGQTIGLFNAQVQLTNLPWPKTGSVAQSIKAELSARLNISEAELNVFRGMISSGSLVLNIANLSALYRLTMLARLLDVKANELRNMLAAVPVANQLSELVSVDSNAITKLDVLERLLAYVDDFKQVRLSLAEAYKLGRTDTVLSVRQVKLDNLRNQLQTSVDNAAEETLTSFNQRLMDNGAPELTLSQSQFDSIFTKGVVTDIAAAVLSEQSNSAFVVGPVSSDFTATQRDAQVVKFREQLAVVNEGQITLFENTLADQFSVNAEYSRVFASWAGEILAEPANSEAARMAIPSGEGPLPPETKAADAPTVVQRLAGQNNDLRARLLSNLHNTARKRDYQTIRQLAAIVKELALQETQLRQLIQRPDVLKGFAANSLPGVAALLGIKRYQLAIDGIDDNNTPIFNIALADSGNTIAIRGQVASAIAAEYEGAEQEEILPLLDYFTSQNSGGRVAYRTLNGLADIILAYQFSERTRLQPQCLLNLVKLGAGDWESYSQVQPLAQEVESSLANDISRTKQQEEMRLESLRDRLLSLALFRMETRDLPVDNANSLYKYLLLDVFVGGGVTTSPVKEATCALQLFADAVMDRQETGHTVTQTFREYWRWMRSYTTWQANRRTFFETENFLLPAVRRDKSEAFKMLENKVNMVLNKPEEAEKVFREFVEESLKTMDLQNVGVALSASNMEPDAIVAREKTGLTRDIYIRFTNLTESENKPVPYLGGEWEKLPLQLAPDDSVCISPVFEQGRWHLFWVTYQQSGQTPQRENLYTAQLNQMSQKEGGGWAPQRVIRERKILRQFGKNVNQYAMRYVSAFPSGRFKLNGTKDQLNKVWMRNRKIESDLAQGINPITVLTDDEAAGFRDSKAPAGQPGVAYEARDIINEAINVTNHDRGRRGLEPKDAFYYSFQVDTNHNSELFDDIKNANESDETTSVDGILLSLPPVFGLFNGESVDIRSFSNQVNNTDDTIKQTAAINNSATVGFFSHGANLEHDNENYITGENVTRLRDTLIVEADGTQKLASEHELKYIGEIKPRRFKKASASAYNYNSQRDFRALSGYPVNNSGTINVTPLGVGTDLEREFITTGSTLYQQFFGTISGQEYLFDKDRFKFIRTSSGASRKLLARLSRFGVDKFMHYDSQRMAETPFHVNNPDVRVDYPRPSERLSFNDFNGHAYREVFFHAPMLIATVLKDAEQYQEAERWYRYVYNPQADGNNLALATGDNNTEQRNFHDAEALRNNFWQNLYLRQTAPSEFVCDAYDIDAKERNKIKNSAGAGTNSSGKSLIEYFKEDIDRQKKPDVIFKAPVLNYRGFTTASDSDTTNDNTFEDWIVNKSDTPISELIVKKAEGFSATASLEDTLMRYRGTQYLSQGAYYLQVIVDDMIAVFVNGDLLFNAANATSPKVYNLLLNVEHSGVQHFEFLYLNSLGNGTFEARIGAAQPGLTLVRERFESASNSADAKLEDSIDYQTIKSQATQEQRLLSEVNAVEDLSARQTYIRDPFNPHALAAVRPSAYKTWTFYEFIDNQIKQGDKLFRRLTRGDLAEATAIYTQVQNLLGDRPKRIGVLDNLPKNSTLEAVRKAGLLDFDGDGDVDLNDADIQARRLVDASNGRLQSALELILEQRLANITRNVSVLPTTNDQLLVEGTYAGDDTTALQITPREVRLDDNGNLVLQPVSGTPAFTPQNYLNNSYFAVPVNSRSLQLWDTLADRLFNIRNGRDINGKRVNLALIPPVVDPLQLTRSSDTDSALGQNIGNANMSIPHYRFNYAINRAKEVAQMVSSFGSRLLSIMEKQDATELEALRAAHEQQILEMSADVLRHQVLSATRNIEIFYRQYETARYQEYRNTSLQLIDTSGLAPTNGEYQLLNKIPIRLDSPEDEITSGPNKTNIKGVRETVGEPFPANQLENASFGTSIAKSAVETVSGILFGISELTKTAPNVFGLAVGGHDYGAIGKGLGKIVFGTVEKLLGLASSITGELGSRARRKAGWEENRQLAIMDQAELKDKIMQGMHDLHAVTAQFNNLGREIRSGQEIERFIKSERRTRTEFYGWLSNRMKTLYFQAYQLALGMAKEAEQALNFELGVNQAHIRGDYWDNTLEGLLAADGLLLSLQNMQHAYEQNNKQRLEITKPISLKNNTDILSSETNFVATKTGNNQGTNLIDLLKAKPASERSLQFELPSKLFARDFPSHYKRLIKSVSITIPAVVGPYQTLSATLRQLSNQVLLENSEQLAVALINRDPVTAGVRIDYRNNQAVAISSAINDSGAFQLNFNDNRFLPFENTGADSSWVLEFSEGIPTEVFNSITDIIIEVKYYAEEGSPELKAGVTTALAQN